LTGNTGVLLLLFFFLTFFNEVSPLRFTGEHSSTRGGLGHPGGDRGRGGGRGDGGHGGRAGEGGFAERFFSFVFSLESAEAVGGRGKFDGIAVTDELVEGVVVL
jgi:hypothetical protein